MKILSLFFSFAMIASAADKSIADLQTQFATERDPTTKFHIENEIVRLYSQDKTVLTRANASDAMRFVEASLKDAPLSENNWDYGNAIHHGHLVLGRLDLVQGKIAEAKAELKAAGGTRGSPQLNSFGPNMTLAKELLQRGERDAVLAYLDDCGRFWNSHHAIEKLAAWKTEIRNGKIPDFQANLLF